MNKYAVMDIGSNSVRLMTVADGTILYKRLQTTRLGEGIAFSSTLCESAMTRTAQAVAAFYQMAKDEGANPIYAFATAAVRSAENGREFIQKVKSLCGLDVEVISGATEAEIGILGALGRQDGTVIDIGGASTEIVTQRDGAISYKKSVDVGVVRLYDLCGRDKDALLSMSKDKVRAFENIRSKAVYAIGGTATSLGALYQNMQTYDGAKVTGTRIALQEMQQLADRLIGMSSQQIVDTSCLSLGRAEVIAGGAIWLVMLMKRLAISSIVICDRDNLEGYAIKKGLKV